MAGDLDTWTNRLSKVVAASLVLLTILVLILCLIAQIIVNKTFPYLTHSKFTLNQHFQWEPQECYPILSTTLLWLLIGIIGLWTLPQILAAFKLKQVSKIVQTDIREGKRIIEQYRSIQLLSVFLDLVLFLTFMILQDAVEKEVQYSEKAQIWKDEGIPYEFLVFVHLGIFIACVSIKIVCFCFVESFADFLETMEVKLCKKKPTAAVESTF